MSDELKPCPLCSRKLFRDGLGKYWLHPTGTECVFMTLLTRSDFEAWNHRPIEDTLRSKLAIAV